MIGGHLSRKLFLIGLVVFTTPSVVPLKGQEKKAQSQWKIPQGYHQSLNSWADSQGTVRRLETLADWQHRRDQAHAGAVEVMGPLPPRENLPPLDVTVTATESRDKHDRFTIQFTTEGTERWTAYLFVPKSIPPQERRPGVLALHPTSPLGKGVVDGQSELPNRAYGRELADRGFVVIAPDYPSFGDHKDYDFEKDAYTTGTMKGIAVHMRAVDVLCERTDVDAGHIAAIGHSLGGHNAIFVGVFDPRIQSVVSSCGWCPFPDYYQGNITGWTSSRYMPSLKSVYGLDVARVPFDFCELIASLAPRRFFSCSPLHDKNFEVAGVRQAQPHIERIYRMHDASDRVVFDYPDAEHDFPDAVRERAYQFLEKSHIP